MGNDEMTSEAAPESGRKSLREKMIERRNDTKQRHQNIDELLDMMDADPKLAQFAELLHKNRFG